MTMKNMKTARKQKDLSTETITQYRNKFNGDIVYSSNKYKTNIIDGVEFLMVFPKPTTPNSRRINWMRKDNLERISG